MPSIPIINFFLASVTGKEYYVKSDVLKALKLMMFFCVVMLSALVDRY
jgi:hypothetical protein